VKLTEPADYTLEVDGTTWDVYAGTHRVHYRCKHRDHVVVWADWSEPAVMGPDHIMGIPEHPQCEHPFENCGHLEVVAGCHERHPHHPDHQPQKLPIRAGLANLAGAQPAGGDGGAGAAPLAGA
jgi:hypothetical protein